MRRNGYLETSGHKVMRHSSTKIQSCSATAIFHKGAKILAILQHFKRVWGIFSPRMRRDGYLGTSGQKSDLAIRFGDADFL